MEPAAWAESIPFNETRDYVKKVLSNSVYYAMLLAGAVPPSASAPSPATTATAVRSTPTLKFRLGAPIGPRDPGVATPDRDLP
jgi:soluble lytic murein transglycosylase